MKTLRVPGFWNRYSWIMTYNKQNCCAIPSSHCVSVTSFNQRLDSIISHVISSAIFGHIQCPEPRPETFDWLPECRALIASQMYTARSRESKNCLRPCNFNWHLMLFDCRRFTFCSWNNTIHCFLPRRVLIWTWPVTWAPRSPFQLVACSELASMERLMYRHSTSSV